MATCSSRPRGNTNKRSAMITEDVMNKARPKAESDRNDKARDLRCLVCDTPVPNVVCGRKEACPSCGFPYPLGDCSDLAEN